MVTAREFLEALHPKPLRAFVLRPPAEAEVVVSTLEARHRWCHHWRTSRRQAAWLGDLHRDRYDMFFSVALHDSQAAYELVARKRASANLSTIAPSAKTAVALPALWASLVAKDGGVDGRALAGLLRSLPEPSCVVATGVGLDLYWLLREPWILEAAAEQAAAARLARGWQKTIRRRARQRGFRVEEQDLGQLLRFPTSFDYDFDDPRPITVEWLGDARYDRRELEPLALPPARAGAVLPEPRRGLGDGKRACRDFVAGLRRLLESLGGRATAAQILTVLERDDDDAYFRLRAALYELFPNLRAGELPSARSLGCKLRYLNGRRYDGLAVARWPKDHRGLRWSVEAVDGGLTPTLQITENNQHY